MNKHESAKQRPAEPQPVSPEACAQAAATAEESAAPIDNAIDQLQAEIEAFRNRELRALAELENYRKRASRELEDRARYANLPLMRDLLPVVDNAERAIQAAQQTADAAALLEGFKMLLQQLEDILQRHHCVRIEALHAPFDPHVHQAILQQPSDEFPPNTVLTVAQEGYRLHDRVVRASQVIVSSPK